MRIPGMLRGLLGIPSVAPPPRRSGIVTPGALQGGLRQHEGGDMAVGFPPGLSAGPVLRFHKCRSSVSLGRKTFSFHWRKHQNRTKVCHRHSVRSDAASNFRIKPNREFRVGIKMAFSVISS